MSADKERIRAYGHSLGFDVVGFTRPQFDASVQEGLRSYLELEHHGDMQWMENNAERRGDPKVLWPEAESIIMLGHNYGPEQNPMDKLAERDRGNISCYAQNVDYHDVIKKKLRLFAEWLVKEFSCEIKLFVDTAPVMEKALAERAGLGWQGKHTCLVSREFGSWLFLGNIFTTLPLAPDEPENMRCGSCSKCLDACPTQAFTGPHQLDARRCIAYLTNEHKGQIPLEFRKPMGNRIYGCDDCLSVCPWNKFAQVAQETAYHARDALKSPPLSELIILDDAAFRALFSKSPVKRIGRARFIRNVLVAAGNSGDSSLSRLITPLLQDESPLVSEMAAWALGELAQSAYIKN